MINGYIIDWPIVAALFATFAAFVAAGVTYFSSKSRNKLDARIEISRYHEKQISELRVNMASFVAELMGEIHSSEAYIRIATLSNLILLQMNPLDKHYEEVQTLIGVLGVEWKQNRLSGEKALHFIHLCQLILSEELKKFETRFGKL